MKPDLLIRPMLFEEHNLVLSDWKKDLFSHRQDDGSWGKALRPDEWWALVNFVIDKCTFPSCHIHMACARPEPATPLAWIAWRDSSILHACARPSVHKEPVVAAYLERELRAHTKATFTGFNPFEELKR